VPGHDLEYRDETGRSMIPVPFVFLKKKKGKLADISVNIEEGKQYQRGKLSFTDVKLFRTPEAVLGNVFQMQEGDIFGVDKLRKGLENMKKLYGGSGLGNLGAARAKAEPRNRLPATLRLCLPALATLYLRAPRPAASAPEAGAQ
jgi:hypothetical protein